MDRQEFLNRLELDNEGIVHQQINSICIGNQQALVLDWQQNLTHRGDPPQAQLMLQTCFIACLKQSRTQIAMNFDYGLNVGTNPNRLDMTLHPTRWMHHLGGFEMGYSTEHLVGWAGGTAEVPVQSEWTDSKWVTQRFENAATAGGGIDLRWARGAIGGSRIGLAYLRTWGGNAPDRASPTPSAGGSQFEFRYPWRDALQLKFRSGLRALKLEGEGKMTWDLNRNSLLGQIDLSFRPLRNWELLLGGNWIQTQNTVTPLSPESPDALGSWADLDSVTAGLRYTF